MTTVRVPVRIRLELPGDRFDAGLLDLVGAATGRASARAVDRAGRTVARTGAAWSGREPEVSVRFRGDPVPEWVAGHLETHVRAAAVRAGRRLAAAAPASTMTVTPIVLTRQLSRFGTAEELYRALERYFAGEPVPPRLLVIAADRAGTAYLFLVADQAVTVLHAMAQWQPQPDGRDAELVTGYSGLNADELRFVTAAETEPAFRTGLARVLLDTQRTAFPTLSEQRLAAQARDRAARYPWRGPKTVLYEFMSQGSPIKAYIYVGDNEPTRSAIPVVTLSEDAPFEPAARTRPPAPALPPPAVADLDPDRPFGHELALADWDPAEYAELSALIDEVLAQTGGGAPPRFVGSFVLA
ncbi:MAG TPA: hypothetical protein VFT95_22150, partial [Micromonosporaceae bacterium]|nr:hypothetical protein [Micromonosporaceae bacterium]